MALRWMSKHTNLEGPSQGIIYEKAQRGWVLQCDFITTVTHMLTLLTHTNTQKSPQSFWVVLFKEFVDSALVLLVCIANMPLDKCVSIRE